jgi:hypothetical protein
MLIWRILSENKYAILLLKIASGCSDVFLESDGLKLTRYTYKNLSLMSKMLRVFINLYYYVFSVQNHLFFQNSDLG